MGPRLIIAIVIALGGVIAYFSAEKVTNEQTGESYRRAIDVDTQKAMGLQAMEHVKSQMGALPATDPDAALVAEVGQKLVRNTGASTTPFADNFNFYLVNDPNTINAFALPGGQICITRGLYERLENEAQLAGVLGHEIGHVIAEHSAQQIAKGQLGQALATAMGVASDDSRVMVSAQAANQMLQLKYGREDERQSDTLGLRYMMEAGYHPEGMLGVMQVLAEASRGRAPPKFLSSHPHPEERIKTIQKFLSDNEQELRKRQLTRGRKLRALSVEN